jgi:hypothetical protein
LSERPSSRGQAVTLLLMRVRWHQNDNAIASIFLGLCPRAR